MRFLRGALLLAACVLLAPGLSRAGDVFVFHGSGSLTSEYLPQLTVHLLRGEWAPDWTAPLAGFGSWASTDNSESSLYDTGFLADGTEYRGYFQFDVAGLGTDVGLERGLLPSVTCTLYDGCPVDYATLRLYEPVGGFVSGNASELLQIFGGFDNGFSFADLGSGPAYGAATVQSSDDGTWLTFLLNSPDVVAALNDALCNPDSSGYIGFGSALLPADTSVPEPASWALLLLPIALGVCARRRRRV